MNASGQTICLCMIVKDETPVIRRCLDSVRPIVDHWIIVDTGSSDGTQDMIREHYRDVPGELVERPWVDFAHNRSEALRLARGKADYVLVIDADEVLEYAPGFALPALEADAYHFEMRSGGVTYYKTQLVRDALDWCFRSVVHEYIHSDLARSDARMEGLWTMRFPDGARARDPLTYRKDALLLETALLTEPNNSRYMFYLAQSYRDANEPELAIDRYAKRAAMGGWIEEVWYSLYQIAEIRKRIGAPWPEVLEAYLAAYRSNPFRAEPLYKIAVQYQAQRDFAIAHLFLLRAAAIPFPAADQLFVEKAVYESLLPIEYAVASFYVGDHAAAIDTNNRLLASADTPAELYDQIVRNRQFSLDALFPKRAQSRGETTRIRICVPFTDAGPHLDNCVESLLHQTHRDFTAVFIDNASKADHSDKIPLEDPRFSLIQNPTALRWAETLAQGAEGAGPEDVILVFDGVHWLAHDEALASVDGFFNDYDCALMYGQYRFSNGSPGLAMPLASADELDSEPRPEISIAPVAVRAGLIAEADLSSDATPFTFLRRAGVARARFNDDPLLVWNLDL